MPSDDKSLREAFAHIMKIKEGTYPVLISQDKDYRIEDRPWREVPERSKLAVLQDAVNWEGVTNRDQAHILLSEIDPGKISDAQRNRLIEMATSEEKMPQMIRERSGRDR